MRIHDYPNLQISFPEKAIFIRLGGNLHRTAVSSSWETTARKFYGLCAPRGRYVLCNILEHKEDGLLLEGGAFLPSRDFASLCHGATHLWCSAVTIGPQVPRRCAALSNLAERTIGDAVGSECAEETMELLHRLAARELSQQGLLLSPRRFSPGYGDMSITVQTLVDSLLHLAEIGVTLTPEWYMQPEKSVTAWAPVFPIVIS